MYISYTKLNFKKFLIARLYAGDYSMKHVWQNSAAVLCLLQNISVLHTILSSGVCSVFDFIQALKYIRTNHVGKMKIYFALY